MEAQSHQSAAESSAKNPSLHAVQTLREWDLEEVKQFLLQASSNRSPAQLTLLEQEYKRVMELRLRHPEEVLPLPAGIDPLWHAHMLFTKDYRVFCRSIHGRFIDHKPVMNERDAVFARTQLTKTREYYTRYFGDPPAAFWSGDAPCVPNCLEG